MSQKSYDNSPTVYLIPTPIGNMDDLTYRSVETLRFVDVIFCEDTRETGKLLKYLDISKPLIANHDHNEVNNKEKLLSFLNSGKNVGLVSDRGTPVISDPGFEIARFAIEAGYNVVGLPGANALIPALIMSGISPKPFTFYGFLNSKSSKRKKELEHLKSYNTTLIFYEAPHRIHEMLDDIKEIMGGERKVAIAREITKKFEEIYRGTVNDIITQNIDFKGEMVIILEGQKNNYDYEMTILEHINLYIEEGYSSKEAIKMVSQERNIKKSEVYDEYIKSKG